MSLTKTKTNLKNLILIAFAFLCMTLLFKVNAQADEVKDSTPIFGNFSIVDEQDRITYADQTITVGDSGSVHNVNVANHPESTTRSFEIMWNTRSTFSEGSLIVTAALDGNVQKEGFSSTKTFNSNNGAYSVLTTVSFTKTGEWAVTLGYPDPDNNGAILSHTLYFTLTADTTAPTIETYEARLSKNVFFIGAYVTDTSEYTVKKVGLIAQDSDAFAEATEANNGNSDPSVVIPYIYKNNESALEEAKNTGDEYGLDAKGTKYLGKSFFEVSENGTYFVVAADIFGNVSYKEVVVSDISSERGFSLNVGSNADIVEENVVTGEYITINIENANLAAYGLSFNNDYTAFRQSFSNSVTDQTQNTYDIEYKSAATNYEAFVYRVSDTATDLGHADIYTWMYDNGLGAAIDASKSVINNAGERGAYTLVYPVTEKGSYMVWAEDVYGNIVYTWTMADRIGTSLSQTTPDSGSQSGSSSSDSSSSSSSSSSSETTTTTTTTTTVTENKETAPITVTYTVKKGDYMKKIAREHGITLEALIALNPQVKNPNLIYAGQVLTVSKTSVVTTTNAATTGTTETKTYTVQRGDSLYKIARKNGMTLAELQNLNANLFAQKYIFAGQTVLLK